MDAVWTDTTQARFETQIEEESQAGYKLGTLIATVFFWVFMGLDYLMFREHWLNLFFVRLIGSAITGTLYFLATRGKTSPAFVLSFLFFIVVSTDIVAMCIILGGHTSPYYAGINASILAVGVLFPWGWKKSGAIVLSCVAVYAFPIIIYERGQFSHPEIFFNNLYFLMLTSVITITGSELNHRLRKQSFERLLRVEIAQEKLRQYDIVKSQFFANVSHELRTPLTLILGTTDRLKSKADTSLGEFAEEFHHPLEIIFRNAKILLKNVDDLLDVAKLESGKAEISWSRFDAVTLIKRVGSLFELEAKERKINFILNLPPELILEADCEKFQKIVSNLFSNAFKFVPDGSVMKCAVSRNNHLFQLQVEDNGPGFPEELNERIFERFRQGEIGNTRRYGGTGLGLAIVKEFIELHRGTVSAYQTPGGGATFDVIMPIKAPDGVQVKNEAIQPRVITDWNTSLEVGSFQKATVINLDPTRNTVLVVEDHLEMNRYIVQILEHDYNVISAMNGTDGLQKAREFSPDLILTDVMMPEMSGDQMLVELRSQSEFDETPILVLTAKSDDELRLHLFERGAQDYIMKPFLEKELLARVKSQISVKISMEVLQRELGSKVQDIAQLADLVITKTRELENSVETEKSTRLIAEDALKSRDRFLSLMSHEFRTPLMIINTSAHMLKKISEPFAQGPEKVYFDRMQNAYQRLRELIETMIVYSNEGSETFHHEVKQSAERFLPLVKLLDEPSDWPNQNPVAK